MRKEPRIMFQIRTQDGVYNPNRDIVQLYSQLALGACNRLAKNVWSPYISDYAKYSGVTQEDLTKAAVALGNFINLSVNVDAGKFEDAIATSGLGSLPGPALMALFTQLGAEVTRAYYSCVRDAIEMGRLAPRAHVVGDTAERTAHALSAESDRVRMRRAQEMLDAQSKQL